MVVFWTTFLSLLAIAYYLLYKYMTRNFSYWKDRNIFYFKPLPFFGNLLPMITMKTTMGELIMDLYRQTDKDYFGIFSLDRPVLVVKSPKLAKDILLKDFASFHDRIIVTPDTDPAMSNLMFFKKGQMWKVIRSKMTPVFTSGKLKAMFSVMVDESNDLSKYLSKFVGAPSIEAKEVCAKYSTNLIALTAFGVKAKCFDNEDADFRKLGRRIFGTSLTNAVRQLGCNFFPGLIKTFGIEFVDTVAREQMKSIFSTVLKARKQSDHHKSNDLVDILLDARAHTESGISDDMILGQAIQFFMAGFEAVASTISFTLYALSMDEEIQERLRLEILENIEENNGLTYEGVNSMKYLNMVISEALRKYPVLPFLDRECTSTYKVEGTDLVLEKGQAIYISAFGMHYDEKYFPDPDKFDPERFSDKNEINKEGFYYTPFGEGPRICIGNRYGLLAVKVGIASILSKYKIRKSLKTPEKIKFDPKSFLIQSYGGVPIKIEAL
nr:Cytochrome P450 [Sitophilus oryzae]